MKKNGFAISAILYSLLALFILSILTIFILLNTKKSTLNAINKDIINSINQIENSNPTIVFNSPVAYVFLNDEFNLLNGIYAFDSNKNDITDKITTNVSSIDTSILQEYEVIYSVIDNKGNKTSISRQIKVINQIDYLFTTKDNEAVSTLNGYIDISVSNADNYVKYFMYRISDDGGITYDSWRGIDTGFDNTKYLIENDELNSNIVGDKKIDLLNNVNYFLTFDYYSETSNNNLNVSLNNFYSNDVLSTINRNTFGSIININNAENEDIYLRLTNSNTTIGSDNIIIEDINMFPVTNHKIEFNELGYFQVQIKIITIDNKELIKTSNPYTIIGS